MLRSVEGMKSLKCLTGDPEEIMAENSQELLEKTITDSRHTHAHTGIFKVTRRLPHKVMII